MALANSVEFEQKSTATALTNGSRIVRVSSSLRPTFVGPVGSHEDPVRSPWTVALHERFPAARAVGPRTSGRGYPPRQALGAAPGFAGREPRRLPLYDCRMAAGFHRLLLQLPRQCARDRRSGEGCQTEFTALLHLRWGSQRLFYRTGYSGTWRGRDRLRAQGRGRGIHRQAP